MCGTLQEHSTSTATAIFTYKMPASAVDRTLTVAVYPQSAWKQIAPVWAELVEESDCSFFLTVPWVETWLEFYGRTMKASILLFSNGNEPVGGCILSEGYPGPFYVPIKRFSLNTAGEPSADTTYVEFNDLLCRKSWDVPVAEALAQYLSERDWDEVSLDGFVEGPAFHALTAAFAGFDQQEVRHVSYHIDLAAIRSAGLSYEMALRGTMRKRLRQNIRYHCEMGPLRLESAGDVGSAIAMLDQLAELSQKRWAALNQRGIFSSSTFIEFHRKLIARCLPSGGVQLLRVTPVRRSWD